jgi:hypothetical protein
MYNHVCDIEKYSQSSALANFIVEDLSQNYMDYGHKNRDMIHMRLKNPIQTIFNSSHVTFGPNHRVT